MQKVKGLWPQKTAVHLSERTSVAVRTAERWLAGTRSMGAEDFIRLLTSDEGVAILEAIVADLPEQRRLLFWQRVKRSVRAAELRMSLRRQREELEQLEFPSGLADLRRGRS